LKQISITVTETAQWHALIGKAEYKAHFLLPQGIEDYLVRLFLRVERFDLPVFKATDAQESLICKEEKLQCLGDQCLLLCGFYPEASDQYGIALESFVSMGAEAYRKLARVGYDEDHMIFDYLGTNFNQVAELLCYVNDFSSDTTKKYQNRMYKDEEGFSFSVKRTESIPFSSPISYRVLN
jgi:hypothetical protein